MLAGEIDEERKRWTDMDAQFKKIASEYQREINKFQGADDVRDKLDEDVKRDHWDRGLDMVPTRDWPKTPKKSKKKGKPYKTALPKRQPARYNTVKSKVTQSMTTPQSFPLRPNKKRIPAQSRGKPIKPALSTATKALIDPVQRAAMNVVNNWVAEVQLSEK